MPTKKVSPVSVVKKPSLASLMPDKTRGHAAKKKAVKKIEATVSKKVASKVVKKPGEQKVMIRRAKKKSPASSEDVSFTLPTRISIRAREKALAILHAVSKDFSAPAQRVAYVAGLCFILLGASLATTFTVVNQEANVIGTQSSSLPQVKNTVAAAPVFSLLDPIPLEVSGETDHMISISDAGHVDVKLFSLETGAQIGLLVDDISEDLFQFSIDAEKLDAGKYIAKVFIESKLDGSKHISRIGEFLVVKQPDPSAAVEEDTTPDKKEVVSEKEPEVKVQMGVMNLTVPNNALSGETLIKVQSANDLKLIEVYLRPSKSISPRILGLAEKRVDGWYYFFNTINEPNGEYELLARSHFDGKFVYSNTKRITISNFTIAPEPESIVAETEIPEDEAFVLEEKIVASSSIRTFSEFSIDEVADLNASTSDYSEVVTFEINDIFLTYKERLQDLLRRYAVAQQSGNLLLIEMSKNELDEARREIVTDILNNKEANLLADDVDAEFSERLTSLQKRIDTFEELRKTASNSESSSDDDNDGISNFDEEHLYLTDFESADTDNDGIQDGVEIMKGFNPSDASPQAIIEYESPYESFGVVENELLKVESINAVTRNDINGTSTPVLQAEIRGRGLPNSYVTLYIFSSPTIVTVRTDKDGSFVYMFEKELEDGAHDIYVAVTDNTGAIVAQSSPFKFIKEAQAFTPIDGNNTEAVLSPAVDNSILNTYNIVIGLGILALGLILLMLGVGLREREVKNPLFIDDLEVT